MSGVCGQDAKIMRGTGDTRRAQQVQRVPTCEVKTAQRQQAQETNLARILQRQYTHSRAHAALRKIQHCERVIAKRAKSRVKDTGKHASGRRADGT